MATRRPLFHSEADFQHLFAWELHVELPEAHIRLERPFETTLGLLHLDVITEIETRLHIVELKYKTRGTATHVGSELYQLQNHGAQPLGRYDMLKDIVRLEAIVQKPGASVAHAILLTNDSAYWAKPRTMADTSAGSSLHDGRLLSGRLDWSSSASPGTKRGRKEAIQVSGRYLLQWRDYSTIEARSYPRFRYLAIDVLHG